MANCLTPAEMQALLADDLSLVDKERVETHLSECESCRKQVDALRAEGRLFGDIRQAYQAETVAKDAQPVAILPSQAPSDSIEGYEILREIHRGGQGVVYKAVQKTTKRTIALKVLLQGPYASAKQRHRFEREIDLVASLQHPNIVTIYDSGITKDQRHFFAMEYIHGQPLDVYLSDKNFSIDDTLRLFQKVCAAVNHAHQRGVIHRDLKPNNILIDANGEPHVLDFGLAKAAGTKLSEGIPVTVTGEFMGTLAYASPEQTTGDPNLIDVRTDVYSLGVILYEMLTSKYPYKVVGQMADVLKNIAEAEPKRPSTIRRQINDEVETVVLKALAKEKERRYQSAEGLARDIEHYLSGKPIDAKRDSGWYMLKKALHRYRIPAAVTTAFIFTGAVFTVSMTLMYENQKRLTESATKAREAEISATKEAREDRDRALEAEELARNAEQDAQREALLARLAAARAHLSINDLGTAVQRLREVPSENRDWEWHFLHAEIERGAGTDRCFAVMSGHHDAVYSIAFSPDGSRVASASKDETVRIWDAFTGEELAVLREHECRVSTVAFSQDGARLVSTDECGMICTWDAITGIPLSRICRESNSRFSRYSFIALSPHGTFTLVGAIWEYFSTPTVRILNTATGEELAALSPIETVWQAGFNLDETKLLTINGEGNVCLWDCASGEQLIDLPSDLVPDSSPFTNNNDESFAISPDGMRLAMVLGDRVAVRVWNVSTGEEVSILRMQEGNFRSLEFSPDSNRLASASQDNTVHLWEVATGTELAVLRGHEDNVGSLEFSPDGNRLASASQDNTVRLWEVATGKVLAVLRGHEGGVNSVKFSPDGDRLVSVSEDNTVRLWVAAPSDGVTILKGHEQAVTSVAFSPDGALLASASIDKTVRIWAMETGQELRILRGHDDWVASVVFSFDGSLLASGAGDETVRVWDTSTGAERGILRGHTGIVRSLAFNSAGTLLASGSWDKTVRLWEPSSGSELRVLRGHESAISCVAFSPAGNRLASASADKTVRLWNPSTGEELAVLRGHENSVHFIAFSPDGARLVSVSADKTVRLWSTSTGQVLAVLQQEDEGVSTAVAFNPQGTRLALASSNNMVRVWDSLSGAELITLSGHEHSVFSVAWNPDGTCLASGSADNTIRVWDSLSSAVRYQQRESVLASVPEADAIVSALWALSNDDPNAVARDLHEASGLSRAQERTALNLLLVKSAKLQEAARELIDELFARLVFTDDVLRALRHEVFQHPNLLPVARMLAQARGDCPNRLNNNSWILVRFPGSDVQAYSVGLRGAEAAVNAAPGNLNFVNTLALAQYRNHLYEDAIATLLHSEQAVDDELQFLSMEANNLPVLAMSLRQIGNVAEAHAALQKLHVLMKLTGNASQEDLRALYEEAKGLLIDVDLQNLPTQDAAKPDM